MRKLIAVDIDGTLINSNHEITDRTKNALIKTQEQGHTVVITSGRSPKGVENLYKELRMDEYEGYICNYNGALATDVKTNEIIINHKIENEKLKKLFNFTKQLDIDFVIYYDNLVYAYDLNTPYLDDVLIKNDLLLKYVPDLRENIDFEPNNVLFCQYPEKIKEPAEKIKEKFGKELEFVFSDKFYFEAMNKGVSKGHTLLELADILDINYSDIIAFGDQNNDFTMIKLAGTGVAMGNAIDALKNIADYVTLTNDEDGVADYIEKYVLI